VISWKTHLIEFGVISLSQKLDTVHLYVMMMCSISMMDDAGANEQKRKHLRPTPDPEYVTQIMRDYWKKEVVLCQQLESYDDCNFFLKCTSLSVDEKVNEEQYLLKFYNGVESSNIDFLNELGDFCAVLNSQNNESNGIDTPVAVQSICGHTIERVNNCRINGSQQCTIAIRLFSWVEGVTLNSHGGRIPLMSDVGRALGRLTNTLQGFDRPSFHRSHAWDMKQFLQVERFVEFIDDSSIRALVTGVFQTYREEVLPDSSHFSQSVILGTLLGVIYLQFRLIFLSSPS
jgi:Ser/Thr protein kinase RdoA (MazF antagonist)